MRLSPTVLIPVLSMFLAESQAQLYLPVWEQPIPSAEASSSVLGDVDGDGDLDALVRQGNKQDSLLLLNDGTGHFNWDTNFPGFDAADLLLEDFNGDTHLDVWVAGFLQPNHVYTNDGSGQFTLHATYGLSADREGAVAVDVDGDTDLDVVYRVDGLPVGIEMYLNDGNANFTIDTNTPWTGAGGDWILAGDVDGDLDPDILVDGQLWINNGTGVFAVVVGPTDVDSLSDASLGDLNGDGHLDFYATGGGSVTATSGLPDRVWFNDGSGTFTQSTQLIGNAYSRTVLLTHLNSDTNLDALVGTRIGEKPARWINDGNGFFSADPVQTIWEDIRGLAEGDLDDDGNLDIFVTCDGDPLQVWLRDASGVLADSGQRIGGNNGTDVEPVDIDSDGDLDLLVSGNNPLIRILENVDCGQYVDTGRTLPCAFFGNSFDIEVGLLNGDSIPDVYVCLNGTNTNELPDKVWFGDGAGFFTASTQELPKSLSSTVILDDIDGNGALDAMVFNQVNAVLTNGQNHILLNDGSGIFTNKVNTLGKGNTFCVAYANVDGNPGKDVFIGNVLEGIQVWFRQPSGFVNSGQLLTTPICRSLTPGFFNTNGIRDLFVGVLGSRNEIYTNNGAGFFTFEALLNPSGIEATTESVTLDANRDGFVDIWARNGTTSPQDDHIYTNNGSGVFTESPFTYGFGSAGGLARGDVTGDGTDDIVLVGTDGRMSVWQHLSTGVVAFAASHGLTGDDTLPFADPDSDGVPNYQEYDANMDPSVSDKHYITNILTATSGLPTTVIDSTTLPPQIEGWVIRRINGGSTGVKIESGTTLTNWNASAETSSNSAINADFERAVLTAPFDNSSDQSFGRLLLKYAP